MKTYLELHNEFSKIVNQISDGFKESASTGLRMINDFCCSDGCYYVPIDERAQRIPFSNIKFSSSTMTVLFNVIVDDELHTESIIRYAGLDNSKPAVLDSAVFNSQDSEYTLQLVSFKAIVPKELAHRYSSSVIEFNEENGEYLVQVPEDSLILDLHNYESIVQPLATFCERLKQAITVLDVLFPYTSTSQIKYVGTSKTYANYKNIKYQLSPVKVGKPYSKRDINNFINDAIAGGNPVQDITEMLPYTLSVLKKEMLEIFLDVLTGVSDIELKNYRRDCKLMLSEAEMYLYRYRLNDFFK